jgi:hypothetical protein
MSSTKTPTQLRLTHDLLERADALIAVMAADPDVRALGMPTRTAVLRLAIARGLRDLEHQYQRPAPCPTTTPYDATPRIHRGHSPLCMRGGTGPACRRPHRKERDTYEPSAPESRD